MSPILMSGEKRNMQHHSRRLGQYIPQHQMCRHNVSADGTHQKGRSHSPEIMTASISHALASWVNSATALSAQVPVVPPSSAASVHAPPDSGLNRGTETEPSRCAPGGGDV
jgi:hypothetical protein